MAILLIIGIAASLRRWREPGYALILLTLAAGLITDTWVGVEATFSANLVALPAVYILPGIGVMAIWRALRAWNTQNAGAWVGVGLTVLLIANAIALRDHLFHDWKQHDQIGAAYHADLGYLAVYLDRTPDDLPVSFCAARLDEPYAAGLTPRQVLGLMRHRDDLAVRHSDCRGGLVLINAGAPMRFAFASLKDRDEMPPELRDWLNAGESIPVEGLPDGSVLRVDVEERVRDAGGQWDTFAQTYYMPVEDGDLQPAPLPAPLEQNLTFAGYDPRVLEGERIAGGDPIVLITYWRVDGRLPARLGIFAHLLAYPQTGPRVPLLEPWAEANSLDVIPAELEKRDIFVQVSYLWLRDNLTPGDYALTVGAYVDTVSILDNHLDVLDPANNNQPHGDRLELGDITIMPAPGTEAPNTIPPEMQKRLQRMREVVHAWYK
jgi:hypothetical protein